MNDTKERWESIRTGSYGAVIGGLTYGITHVGLSQFNLPNFTSTVSVVNVAIASISGFLFAVTYRYIVRDDQNPHLKSGAVSAFGLVRGLAQIQEPLDSIVNIMAIAESLILFNVIRYGLEFLWQRIHRLT